jgi:hypothetical protein
MSKSRVQLPAEARRHEVHQIHISAVSIGIYLMYMKDRSVELETAWTWADGSTNTANVLG